MSEFSTNIILILLLGNEKYFGYSIQLLEADSHRHWYWYGHQFVPPSLPIQTYQSRRRKTIDDKNGTIRANVDGGRSLCGAYAESLWGGGGRSGDVLMHHWAESSDAIEFSQIWVPWLHCLCRIRYIKFAWIILGIGRNFVPSSTRSWLSFQLVFCYQLWYIFMWQCQIEENFIPSSTSIVRQYPDKKWMCGLWHWLTDCGAASMRG